MEVDILKQTAVIIGKKFKIIEAAFENRIVGNSDFSYGQRF